MKLVRMVALVGAAAWLNKKFGAKALDRARTAIDKSDVPVPGLTRGTSGGDEQATPVSGPGHAVDHERTPGVPPPTSDDYADDQVDRESAESFPASDPPGGW